MNQKTHKKARRSPKQIALEKIRAEVAATPIHILPPASRARAGARHWGILISFILVVLVPVSLATAYLYERAADQYASYVGFTVRQANATSGIELLGGFAGLTGSSTSDTDVLYSFLGSQELVRKINETIDIASMWSKPQNDPIFIFNPEGTIEDLTEHWRRMVSISYDSGAGLIEIRTLAFEARDAFDINTAIVKISSDLVNELSAIARDDTTRYAKEDLDRSIARLKVYRIAITAFRNENQIVDPIALMQGQVGLMNTLQQQLAATLIDYKLLTDSGNSNDPRIGQATRKIKVIRNQIIEERLKLGIGDTTSATGREFANMVGEYESLVVDLDFAQLSYTAALAAYEYALAEANRQSRYLAAYLQPTLAERAEFPRRPIILGLTTLFLFLLWSIGVLVFYSLKDRQARL